jgi:hypothetical protein
MQQGLKKAPELACTDSGGERVWRAVGTHQHLPTDKNPIENQIRPIVIGRNYWLFVGLLRVSKRGAAITGLI